MAAPPAGHENPLDPQRILDDLPGDEREFFLAEHRVAASTVAADPAAWPELARLLRLWRFHAGTTKDPGYREASEEAWTGTGRGMVLEDVIRMREAGALDDHIRGNFAL